VDERLLAVVEEMRDLLHLIAEPRIAERDAKKWAELKAIVGSGAKGQKAVQLMDGTTRQKDIAAAVPMSQGTLSDLVKKLSEVGLCTSTAVGPKLTIQIPPSGFFEEDK
jgi:hypothetical protein